MGASKRKQMSSFDDDWPDQIWAAVEEMNGGIGAAWRLPVAALAVTGCRPAALEKGVVFALIKDHGKVLIEATIAGVKLTENRGQPEYRLRWASDDETHRPKELGAILAALMDAPGGSLTVRYDAEAISTRLREVSSSLWPRRRYRITGYCYRELLSSTAKAAGADRHELALAMGHRSTESANAYARAGRIKRGCKKPWGSVSGSVPVKANRSPMARFKAFASLRKKRGGPA